MSRRLLREKNFRRVLLWTESSNARYKTLGRRGWYGGRKGRSAIRRLDRSGYTFYVLDHAPERAQRHVIQYIKENARQIVENWSDGPGPDLPLPRRWRYGPKTA